MILLNTTLSIQSVARSVLLPLLMILLCSLSAAVHAQSDLIYEPLDTTWNNKKVYLSPARHGPGDRGECGGSAGLGNLLEDDAAYRFAYYATSGNYYSSGANTTSSYRNLRTRGYKVRIGRGTVSSAISNSNAWLATVHIPIHSNARTEDCSNNDASLHGTHVIYQSYGTDGGEGLAGKIKDTVGPASPGTNDLICHNSSACTAFNCLGELCNTSAKAAYIEREFHTWNAGAKWMASDELNAWRLGWAVDLFLGYPR